MTKIPYEALLVKTAHKSNHKQHHMAALLMRGGKVIEIFTNNDHIHAEHAVLNRSWRSGADGATMVVVRVKATGEFGMAKPCMLCTRRMEMAGVKRVIYTNDVGECEIVKLQKNKHNQALIEYPFVRPSIRQQKVRYGR